MDNLELSAHVRTTCVLLIIMNTMSHEYTVYKQESAIEEGMLLLYIITL